MVTTTNDLIETRTIWKEGSSFEGRSPGFSITIDSNEPLTTYSTACPRELYLISRASSAGADLLVRLCTDYQIPEGLEIISHGHLDVLDGKPTLCGISHCFILKGDIDPVMALRLMKKSQDLFSFVGSLLFPNLPESWALVVNGVGAGGSVTKMPYLTGVSGIQTL